METKAELDLSNEAAWRGLRLGMTNKEVVALLHQQGVPYSPLSDDGSWLSVEGDWDMELRFEESGQQALRQVSWGGGDLTWKGAPIAGEAIHDAVQNMGTEAEGAAWSPDDAVNDPFDGSGPAKTGTISDEELLAQGTLWLPKRNMGLVMCEGTVIEIVCRRAGGLPPLGSGPLTAAQLSLSKQPNLSELLRKRWVNRGAPTPASMKWTPIQWVIALIFVASLGVVAKKGFAEMQAWQKADVLSGSLINIETRPVKQGGDLYHIAYKDPQGRNQEAALERADFYVSPTKPGEEVQICYVAGNPPRVKGPSRAKDAAFLEYMPLAAGMVVVYMIVQIIAGFVSRKIAASTPEALVGKPPSPLLPQPTGPPSPKNRKGPPGAPPGGPSATTI